MATIRITGPDGRVVKITPPDGATDEQIAAKVEEVKAGWGKPQTSATGAFVTGLGQSLFGLGDEIEAGVRAAGAKLSGSDQSLGEIYDERLKDVRDRVDASAEQHPLAYYGGEIGGSVALPGGLARLGVKSATKAALQAGKGLPALMRAGATEAGAYGAAYGFGKGEEGFQNRTEGAIGSGLLSAGLGAAAPAVIAGGQAAVQPVKNAINAAVRPLDEAAKRIGRAMDADAAAHAAGDAVLGAPQNQQLLQDAQGLLNSGRAGAEVRNIDRGGESVRALARSAANNSPEAREIINRMTNERFEGQADRVTTFLRNMVGLRGNADMTREISEEAARLANRPAYRAAYTEGDRPIWSDTIERLAGAPIVRQAMQRAATRGQDRAIADGMGAFNPGVQFDPSGRILFRQGPRGVPTYPNLQYWDYVKRELDDMARMAARQGDAGQAGVARQFARELRDDLGQQVGAYNNARGQAAQFFDADNALEAGERFATGKFNVNGARLAVDRMTPNERQAFTEGYFSRLLQNIDETGDRRNIVGRLANSPAERERMAIALGPNGAREFEAFLHVEQLMDLPRTAMGNSTTARQLVELGLAGGAGMLASGGSLTDPTTWIVGALTKFGAAKGQRMIDEKMARAIAQMLVSRDPSIYQRGVKQAAHGPVLGALRRISGALADGQQAAIGSAAGGLMAQEGATQ